MSSQLTHERCSELLSDYLAGELDSEQHRLVEDHLEHCAQCSVERAGLAALRTAEEDEGLTGDERVVLRAGVLEAIRDSGTTSPLQDESDAVVVPLRGRASRASKYLGIAAILAILAVGSAVVFGGGGGMSGFADSDAGSGGLAEDSDEGGEEVEGATPAQGSGGDDEFRLKAENVRPDFQSDRGAISEDDLDSFGQRAALTFSLSGEASTSDPQPETEDNANFLSDQAPEESLERLVARAPEPLAVDVTECGRTALEELDQGGLATYATTATLEGEDSIVIAFVTGARTPESYAVFAFPRDDCTTILTTVEGPLD
jgi:Putative zinc-finger